MKPIGQTFFINEPATGVPGIFITKVDIYFKSVSSIYGVELQIRTTLNGVPTQERLPFGKKILYPDGGVFNRPVASEDASLPTKFVFDTPVFVESGKSYALVLLPLGGNPDYQVWTAEIGQTDVSINTPIYTNNDTGDLFLSSNDRTWLPVITEDIKFTIYNAEFVDDSGLPITNGKAVIRSPNEDYMSLNNVIGQFVSGELLYPTTNKFTSSAVDYYFPVSYITLAVGGINGSFNVGDTVYQTQDGTSGGTVTATGKIYATSTSSSPPYIKVSNITGAFNSTYNVYNTVSPGSSYATVSSSPGPNQSIITTNGANTVNIPDASLFAINDVICISTNSYSVSQLVQVSVAPSAPYKTIQVNNNISFTDNSAILSKVMYNGTLHGGLGALSIYPDSTKIILDNVTAVGTNTFANSVGGRLVGMTSMASAVITELFDVRYNQMSPAITNIAPANTNLDWSFTGVKNGTYANDFVTYASNLPINQGISNEFIDFERILMSRSNELTNMPNGRLGERSVNIFANLSSSNTKISPTLDIISKLSHFTRNLCEPEYNITGYYLNTNNMNGTFNVGDIVQQGTTVGNVQFANTSYMRIVGVQDGTTFQANATTIVKQACTSVNAVITSASYYSEIYDNGKYDISRYISKTVLLADTQNSEDIIAYLGAYRPYGTNLKVYARIKHNQDSQIWDSKHWSLLTERTPSNLVSSQVNIDDQVELQYGFPQSINFFQTSTGCNTSSANVSVFSTSGLSVGQFVYISDSSISAFNVRQIISVVNSSVIVVDSNPTFANASSTSAAFGIIPIASKSGAFLNDQNNNIVRYVTSDDHVFDSYSQFAIKIVPVSNTTAIVPRVADLRVLALQA
jgi:hypothetical protein